MAEADTRPLLRDAALAFLATTAAMKDATEDAELGLSPEVAAVWTMARGDAADLSACAGLLESARGSRDAPLVTVSNKAGAYAREWLRCLQAGNHAAARAAAASACTVASQVLATVGIQPQSESASWLAELSDSDREMIGKLPAPGKLLAGAGALAAAWKMPEPNARARYSQLRAKAALLAGREVLHRNEIGAKPGRFGRLE